MEVKYGTVTLLLFVLLVSLPYISRGGGLEVGDQEIYEIDYRGPETHTSVIPPPNHFRHRRPSTRNGVMAFDRPKGSSGGATGDNNDVKVHG